MKFLGRVMKGKLGFGYKTPLNFLLDEHPGAVFAISHTKLKHSYSGFSFRIERESDGVNVNVGFDNFDLASLDAPITEVSSGSTNASLLGEFLASPGYTDVDSKGSPQDAEVVRAYDSSGNGNDAIQNTSASRPKFAIDGNLVQDSEGNYGLEFDGVDDFLLIPSDSTLDLNTTGGAIVFRVQEAGGFRILQRGSGFGNESDAWFVSTAGAGFSGELFTNSTFNDANNSLIFSVDYSLATDSDYITFRGDGSELFSVSAPASPSDENVDLDIGRRSPNGGEGYLEGVFASLVIYNSAQGSSNITSIESFI